jgi:quercetin dioxygenase-like cupin family protein
MPGGAGTIGILADGEETGGAFALIEAVSRPGSEPPLHVHEREDELFYILEGEARVMVGEAVHNLSAGDMIFLPRGVPHTFRIKSPVARALTWITPAGFEQWFPTWERLRRTRLARVGKAASARIARADATARRQSGCTSHWRIA